MREGRGVRGRARETSPNGSARVDASSKCAWARATPPRGSRVRARASSSQLQHGSCPFSSSARGGGRRTCSREGASGVFMRSLAAAVVSAATNAWRRWISRARDAPAGRRGWVVARVEGWRGSDEAPGFCCDLRRILMLVRTRLSLESVSARLSAFRHFRRRAVRCTRPANLSHRRRYGLPSLHTSTSTRARPIERPRDPVPAPPPLDSRAA